MNFAVTLSSGCAIVQHDNGVGGGGFWPGSNSFLFLFLRRCLFTRAMDSGQLVQTSRVIQSPFLVSIVRSVRDRFEQVFFLFHKSNISIPFFFNVESPMNQHNFNLRYKLLKYFVIHVYFTYLNCAGTSLTELSDEMNSD